MPKPRDTTPLVTAVATVVREHVGKAFRSLADRIDGLERKFSELPTPRDGRDGVDGRQGERGEKGDPGLPGERGLQGERGDKGERGLAGERGEKGEPGVPGERGIQGERGEKGEKGDSGVQGERGEKGEPGPQGEPGIQGDPGESGPPGRDGVNGKDGTSITIADVRPIVDEFMRSLPSPKDGRDGKNGVDGKSLTLEDIRPLLDSSLATWALEFERRAQDTLQRAIDRIPAPKDGRDGKDGRDALDLDDFDVKMLDDDRTLVVSLARGERRVERQFVLSHPIYHGIWRQGDYRKGDCVTFGGSAFIALRDTSSKPETDDSWRLSVKRGRDGKDGVKGDRGEPGRNGRDMTAEGRF